MEGIKKRWTAFIIFFTTGLISGLILGAGSITALVSWRLDNYHLRVQHLETIIEDKNIRLEKLEESINKRKFILKDVDVVLSFDGEDYELDTITFSKYIKEKYTHLLGKEVKNIDIDTASEIIDHRIFMINGKNYKLNVTKLTLSDILKLWIKVELMN